MYKKMIEIATSEGSKKLVYKGEYVDFCTEEDFNQEYKFCEGRYRLGEVIVKGKKMYVEYYDAILDDTFTEEITKVKVLAINPSKQIRDYYEKVTKGDGGNEEEQTDD